MVVGYIFSRKQDKEKIVIRGSPPVSIQEIAEKFLINLFLEKELNNESFK